MAYVFGAGTTGFGAQTGWELQSATVNKNKSLARALDKDGQEVAINAFNEVEEVSCVYKCSSDTNTVPADLGAEVNGYVLTGIEIALSPDDYATMTLTGHKHNAGSPTAPGQTAAHGVTVETAFGIPVAPLTGASTGNTGADWSSVSIRISCEHAEANGRLGTSVAHENYDAKIEVTLGALSAITAPTGYTTTAQTAPSVENTGFNGYSLTCQKKLTLA